MSKSAKVQNLRRFGFFEGVFLPTVLSILGVIMYLRLAWVIGHNGIIGALVIIVLSKAITVSTALSVSSMATNINVEGGGAYSIIAKSLGIEAGGAVGIPLYLAQTLSIVFYIIGFTEAFLSAFPELNYGYNPQLISLAVWLILQLLCFHSTNLTIKLQYFIFAFILLSLVSFFLGSSTPVENPVSYALPETKVSFWMAFAVFFPAVTGVLAGIGMSGELKNPKRALPLGSLTAIGFSFIIYIALTFWLANIATPAELRDISPDSPIVMVVKARWPWLVLLGVMGATLSSALGALLAAPRVAEALGQHKILPFSSFFSKRSKSGEPQNAVLVTGMIIGAGLILGSLDNIAQLLTVFFLLTYGTLNLIVFIEDSIGVVSFRPTFKVPRFVALIGAVGCLLLMLLISKIAFLIAIVATAVIYVYLLKRNLEAPFGDVRAGLFTTFAEYFARVVAKLPDNTRSWTPKFIIPVQDPNASRSDLLVVRDIASPGGSITAFTITDKNRSKLKVQMDELLKSCVGERVHAHSLVANSSSFISGASVVTQTVRSMAVRPNVMFFAIEPDGERDELLKHLFNVAVNENLGVVMLARHPQAAFGLQNTIRVWLHEGSPDWSLENTPQNWHLAMLAAIRLADKWKSSIELVTVVRSEEDVLPGSQFLAEVGERARLPKCSKFNVEVGSFSEVLTKVEHVDLNIFGIGPQPNFDFFRKTVQATASSCLFVKDSGKESAIDV